MAPCVFWNSVTFFKIMDKDKDGIAEFVACILMDSYVVMTTKGGLN